jgi:thiol-disulfide isomerase/thioredoxin
VKAVASALAGLMLLASAAACSSPGAAAYQFHARTSGVKVDSPQLRALKAATSIEPCPAVPGTESVPGGLPDETLPCLGGGHSVDLAGLRGPLLLNFWSPACGPCRDESPLLQRFSTAARGHVDVMGVDFYDPNPSAAITFAKQLGIVYPQLADPEAATKATLHISGLPVTLFVSSSGRVTYTHFGALTSQAELDQLVKQDLGVTIANGSTR